MAGEGHDKKFSGELRIPRREMNPSQIRRETAAERKTAAKLIRGQIDQIYDKRKLTAEQERRASEIATAEAEKAAVLEAHRRYHKSWQQYYQKYYERYYQAALEAEKQKMAAQTAKFLTQNVQNSPTGNFAKNIRKTETFPETFPREKSRMAPKIPEQKSSKNRENASKSETEIMRREILAKIKSRAQKVKKSRHFVPAAAAVCVVFLALFVQYNSVMFAAIHNFLSPGEATASSIIVGTGADQPVSDAPRLIIPKINVNVPVTYGLTDLSEANVQRGLQNSPVHYPIKDANALPGENGNTVILGHSGADWFAPGEYKFVFLQLNRLATNDIFYLDYGGTRYTYKITRTARIWPTEVDKLRIGREKPVATLITCDPPGVDHQRFVVFADQISPDPAQAKNINHDSSEIETITGSTPTLFEQIFGR